MAAALTAASFVAGGVVPLLALAGLGGLAGHAGGARVVRRAVRVTSRSAAAMALTAAVGRLFGVR